MVKGVTEGFRRDLEMEGVGFRASVQGRKLEMNLGFAAPVVFEVPEGVDVAVEGGTAIAVSGPDKQQVGQAAARIRSFFPAEPYKGKGLRYKGEYVRRKVGKTVA
jgi:large subunit ribosomal protein L6